MMTNRPPEFDAAVMKYMPMLRNLAVRYVPAGRREDTIQDALAYAFEHWSSFRGDYARGGGFASWLRWQFRSITTGHKRKKRLRIAYGDRADRALRTATAMDDHGMALVAKDILRRITSGRKGGVLLRRGMGDSLAEIGADLGVSRERVRQIVVEARDELARIAA